MTSKTTKPTKRPVKKKTVVVVPFLDRDGQSYKVGDEYKGRPERIAALSKAEVTDLNRVGKIFLAEK